MARLARADEISSEAREISYAAHKVLNGRDLNPASTTHWFSHSARAPPLPSLDFACFPEYLQIPVFPPSVFAVRHKESVMTILSEWNQWFMAWAPSDGYSASTSYEFPPSAVFAKVSCTFFMEYDSDDVSMFSPGIVSIRRRKPDNSDETVAEGNAPSVWDPNMTSITVGIYIYKCQAQLFTNLEFWG